ncbi:MAG: ATP phosphoribosyltransferase [Candidatus Omnitrophota bacterium]
MEEKIKLGLPKGSLEASTVKMFNKAGFNVKIKERSYFPSIDDAEIECVLLRAQEMSRYVADGALDCGITGNDWICENNSDVERLCDLEYAKQSLLPVRWVVAVPESCGIRKIKDLEGKLIATELVNVTKAFLKKNKVKAKVEFSWGATEVKVRAGMVDAIVELTETGSSLRANRLIEIATVCTSTTQFIANKTSYRNNFKKRKMQEIIMLLKGAILSESKVGLKMNVPKGSLKKIISLLPALREPTVSSLTQENWCAIETIINEFDVRRLIPRLREAGAEGIIEYPLNKVIY